MGLIPFSGPEAGKAESGTYEIYGSNEILSRLRHPPFNNYSNVLVLFRNGRASVILPVLIDSGPNYEWRKSLREWFTDLPPAPTHVE
jgi:hypothetical protein